MNSSDFCLFFEKLLAKPPLWLERVGCGSAFLAALTLLSQQLILRFSLDLSQFSFTSEPKSKPFYVLFQCLFITSVLLCNVCFHVLFYVWEFVNSDLSLLSAPLSLRCADSLTLPTGFCSAKLQSVGQHWSASVRGLPLARQLGLPKQQLQLHARRSRGTRGTSVAGDKRTKPQRTRGCLHSETMTEDFGRGQNSCFVKPAFFFFVFVSFSLNLLLWHYVNLMWNWIKKFSLFSMYSLKWLFYRIVAITKVNPH